MNRFCVAKELVGVSRLLVATDDEFTAGYPYPPGAETTRLKFARDAINQALAAGVIYGTDWKKLKAKVNDAFSDATRQIGQAYMESIGWYELDPRERINIVKKLPEWVRNLPVNINGFPKFAKRLLQDPRNFKSRINTHVRSWKPWVEAMLQVAELVQKGRKPKDPSQSKTVYAPKAPDPSAAKKVEKVLQRLVKKQYSAFVNDLTDSFMDMARKFIKARKPNQTPFNFYRNNGSAYVVEALTEPSSGVKPRRGEIHKVRQRKDMAKRARILAKREADVTKEMFIQKNKRKIAPIATDKGALKSVSIIGGGLQEGGFSGSIRFEFNDGTAFTVRNKAVVKWSSTGKRFRQFPTTFHDVVWPSGRTSRMVSEQKMNDEWAQE